MTRSMRIFVLSLCFTLMTLMFIAGIYVVTKEGRSMAGETVGIVELDYSEVAAAYEVADNALTFFAPEVKAAAHWGLVVCAALSELY